MRGTGALAALLLARAALARLGGSLLGALLLLGAALLLLGELAGGRRQLGVAAGVGPRGALGRGLGGLFQVEARDLDLGDVALDELLDGRQLVFVLGADEGDREALGSGAARAADAVHVVLGLGGHVVVHHVGHLVDVDAAGQHVGGHEDVGLAGGEVVQGAFALVLGAVGMDGLGVVAGPLQLAAGGVGPMARAGEDDDALVPPLFQERRQKVGLQGVGHVRDVLLHGVGRLALRGDLHNGRIIQHGVHLVEDALVDGGREQKRLAAFRRRLHDTANRGEKSHVEHAVGLVQHEHLNLREVDGLLVHEVDEAPRRGDEHVHAAREAVDLRLDFHAAHHIGDAQAAGAGDGLADFLNLHGQLSRGGDDEHGRCLLALGAGEDVQARQREGGRFARAGLGGGDDVAALEDERDGLGLNGGRLGVAEMIDGGKDGVGKAEFGKGGHETLFRGSDRDGSGWGS